MRTAITVTRLGGDMWGIDDPAGAVPDAVNGNSVAGADLERLVLRVVNDSGAPVTAMIGVGALPPPDSPIDLVVTVADGETSWIGPFVRRRFDQADGSLELDASAADGVLVTAFEIGRPS